MTRTLFAAAFFASMVPASMSAWAQPPAPPPGTPAEPACLRQIDMYDFKPVPGNRSLIVIDRGRKRFRVNFVGQCYDLQYPMGLRFKTNGTSNLSCVSRGDKVLFHDPAGPGFCMIHDVQYQTPAMDQLDAAAAAARKQQ